MKLTVALDGESYEADLSAPLDIAIPVRFEGAQLSAFGAPPATREVCRGGSFIGDVAQGGSCNAETYTIMPHGNGTHTECIGHIAKDRIFIHDVLQDSFLPATLVTITPAQDDGGDEVIGREAMERALAQCSPAFLEALVVRTLPNEPAKTTRQYGGAVMPPYFTPEALAYVAARGVKHLLCDLPSVDRMDDGGRLLAHRAFWGVAPGQVDVQPSPKTITELIYVPGDVADGAYLLNLQVAAFKSDAAPSRPVLYKVCPL